MQEDADLAIITPLIAECVLNLCLVTCSGASEIVVAHSNTKPTRQLDLMVVIHAVCPAFATINGKSCVFGIATINNIASNEVRHGFLCCRAELIFGSLGWLKQDIRVAIGIQLTRSISCSFYVITFVLVSLADCLNCTRPCFLHCQHLLLGDRFRCRSSSAIWDR